jgi:hypothetical protein
MSLRACPREAGVTEGSEAPASPGEAGAGQSRFSRQKPEIAPVRPVGFPGRASSLRSPGLATAEPGRGSQ